MVYNVVSIIAVVVAAFFVLLVFFTGKGDAMSGGASGVRTTFKGKASFEDKIFYFTMYFGVGFMVLMLLLDAIAERTFKG